MCLGLDTLSLENSRVEKSERSVVASAEGLVA